MADPFTQKLLPSAEMTPESVCSTAAYTPTAEAVEAFDRLEDWLLDAVDRPKTPLGGAVLHDVAKLLLEGKKSYFYHAAGNLEAILVNPSLAVGKANAQEEKACLQAVFHLSNRLLPLQPHPNVMPPPFRFRMVLECVAVVQQPAIVAEEHLALAERIPPVDLDRAAHDPSVSSAVCWTALSGLPIFSWPASIQ